MSKQKITVVEPQEGVADVRLCSDTRQAQDDLQGQCNECGGDVFYRPHPPFLCRFLCLKCALVYLKGAKEMPLLRCSPEAARLMIECGAEVIQNQTDQTKQTD